MRDSLDILESNFRRQANQHAREICQPRALRAFAFGVIFAPGALLAAMFIPVFGVLLTIAVLVVALIYARLKRSLAIVAAAACGAVLIIAALSILGTALGKASNPLLYTLLATCVASNLIALIVLGGAIIGQHEAGFRSNGSCAD